MTENQAKVVARVNQVLQQAIDLYGKQYPRVKFYLSMLRPVRFDIRGYRMLGVAVREKNGNRYLRFHPKAVEKYLDEILNNTVSHEVAHLVCQAEPLLGCKHNKGWRRVCLALGGDATRNCRRLDIDLGKPSAEQRLARRLALRPHVYTDSKGVARKVTTRVHNRIQRGAVYSWRDNGGRVSKDSAYKYAPMKRSVVAVKSANPVQKSGTSKADLCRGLIRDFYGKVHDSILIDKIAYEVGLSKALARKYFTNNLAKAFQA